jgi:hypothetical protein
VHEHVLRQLHGLLPRTAHAEAEREHPAGMRVVQVLECGFIARDGAASDGALVIWPVGNERELWGHLT